VNCAPEIGVDVPNADNRNQFFTGSYLLQSQARRRRPFFQAGAGAINRRFHTAATFQDGTMVRYRHTVETDTSLALLLGAGATIDVGESRFVRPQLRVYMYVGPTFALVPPVGFGYRF
jgi:hypothetical protein